MYLLSIEEEEERKMKGSKKKIGGGSQESHPLPNGLDYNGRVDEEEQPQHHREEADGDDDAEEEEAGAEEEDEEEDETVYQQYHHDHHDQDDDEAGEEAERPKLDEGFYEIEAVRRKRVRKGQLQYLIKWRGWPETANTWEPLENLQSCSDVIDAFEDSLRSGKHRTSRRRKRKYGGPHTQPKKKQQRSADNVAGVELRVVDEALPSPPFDNSSLAELPATPQYRGSGREEGNNEDAKNAEMANQANENGSASVSHQIQESKEGIELGPKLDEPEGTMSTDEVKTDKFAVHFQEARGSEGDGSADGLSKVNCVEPVQTHRRTGARRRKSGSVRRFKQDSSLCEPVDAQNSTARITVASCDGVARLGTDFAGDDSGYKNKFDDSKYTSAITEIIKPISYSASVSNNIQDVLVTFIAMRSDGKEVMVDNKFLKANNPLLLINFYEQHLRYSPTS